jgi:hypothetical protein
MKLVRLSVLVLTALASSAFGGDLVIKKQKHSDALKMRGMEEPAKDSTETIWVGKDRVRTEDGHDVTIVRADLKKMWLIDTQAKTYTAFDLPVDMKKYMPAEYAPMIEQMMGQMKTTVTPTTETKKIKDWNATKVVVTTALPMGGSSTQEMWVTKDLKLDMTSWGDMYASMMSAVPFGGGIAAEMKKLDGFPVLIERNEKMMGSERKSSETVVSVEELEPAAGLYDLPTGFTEKPFDPMAEMGGPGQARGR